MSAPLDLDALKERLSVHPDGTLQCGCPNCPPCVARAIIAELESTRRERDALQKRIADLEARVPPERTNLFDMTMDFVRATQGRP